MLDKYYDMLRKVICLLLVMVFLTMPANTALVYAQDNEEIPTVDNLDVFYRSTDTIGFSWEAVDGYAAIIYRDGSRVAELDFGEDEFIDEDLDEHFNHDYRISLTDGEEEGAKGSVNTISTKDSEEPPVISDVEVHEDSDDPVINFYTDEGVSGDIEFTSPSTSDTSIGISSEDEFQTEYSIDISSLERDNVYSFTINACRGDNCAESDEQSFMLGDYDTPPSLDDIQCPSFSNSRRVTIGGSVRPKSSVNVSVDDVLMMSRDVGDNGLFVAEGVSLASSGETEVHISAEDISGNTAETTCTIEVDSNPPDVEIDELPEFTDQSSIDISLSTDKPIDVDMIRFLVDEDKVTPGEPGDFEIDEETSSSVSLTWEEPEEGEVSTYVIYRDDVPIDTTDDTSYTDDAVISDRSYEYRLRAIDSSCNEGPFTESLSAETDNGDHFSFPPEELENICAYAAPAEKSERVDSELETSLSLEKGLNKVYIVARDDAGNSLSRDYEVDMDDEEIVFEETNLDDYDDVVYSPHVVIRGKTSKDADVEVILNKGMRGEEVFTTSTDDSRKFSTRVNLSRNPSELVSVDEDDEEASIDFSSEMEWPNTIHINASDEFGNYVVTEGEITHAICGGGTDSDFRIDFPAEGRVTPSEIIPRHLIEGIATLGMGYELDYRGRDENMSINAIRVTDSPIATISADNYNSDWIDDLTVTPSGDFGYVHIRLSPDPRDIDPDKTLLKQEKEIAKTNRGKCFGSEIAVGMESEEDSNAIGCVRLPLEFEVDYSVGGEQRTQKECLDVSVQIDNRIDTKEYRPSWMMKAIAAASSELVDLIDELREYTRPLVKRTTQACFVSFGLDIVKTVGETISCTRAAPHVTKYALERNDGEYEVVPLDSAPDDEDEMLEQKDLVQSCFDSMVEAEDMRRISRLTCNRVACTAIPTFERYISDESGELFQGVSSGDDVFSEMDDLRPSYCAEFEEEHSNPYDGSENARHQSLMEEGSYNDDEIGEFTVEDRMASIFNHPDGGSWQQHKSGEWCEQEYMYEYENHCLFRNPYRESFCLYASNNREELTTLGDGLEGDFQNYCQDNVVSSISDISSNLNFCQAQDDEEFGVIIDGEYYWVEPTIDTNVFTETRYNSNDVFLIDVGPERFSRTENERGTFNIEEADREIRDEDMTPLTLERFSSVVSSAECDAESTGDACSQCAEATSDNPCCPDMPSPATDKTLPPAIASYMCEPVDGSEENVINPTDGFFDALTCGCFNAIDRYLAQIQQVSEIVRDCFTTVLETGDGEPGMCQQVATTYLCDIFYSAFDCFTSFAGGGIGLDPVEDSEEFSPGILEQLSLAGSRVSDRIDSEYGDTAMYDHLFVEKNFANSFCWFAISGEWPDGFFEGAVEAAREDVAIDPIMTCSANRRFQTFDTTTGSATYVYDVAPLVIAGSGDTQVDIELRCSTEQGSDCHTTGQQDYRRITQHFSQSSLDSGDKLDEQEFIMVDDDVRYDKVRISVDYENNEGEFVEKRAECDISQRGSDAPGFCEFDPLDGRFFCRITGDEGSARFVDDPEPVKDEVNVNDPEEDRVIGFKTYSVRSYSPADSQGERIELRINAEDNLGNQMTFDSGRTTETVSITSDALTSLGRGGDSDMFDIPKLTISRRNVFGHTSQRCTVYADGGSGRSSRMDCEISDSGSLDYIIEEDGGELTAQPGEFERDGDETNFIEDGDTDPIDMDGAPSEGADYGADFDKDEGEYRISISGMDFTRSEGDFPIVVSADSDLDSIGSVTFTFKLIGSGSSLINYNGRPQERRATVDINTGDPDDEEELDENQCPLPEASWSGDEDSQCTCGNTGDGCSAGQVCCVVPDHDEMSLDVGYCVDEDIGCHRTTPLPSNNLPIVSSVSRDSGLVRFTLDNVINEINPIEGSVPGIYVSLLFQNDEGDEEGDIDSDSERFITQVDDDPLSGSTRIQTYDGVRVSVFLDDEGCYDMGVEAINKKGVRNVHDDFGSIYISPDDPDNDLEYSDESCDERGY